MTHSPNSSAPSGDMERCRECNSPALYPKENEPLKVYCHVCGNIQERRSKTPATGKEESEVMPNQAPGFISPEKVKAFNGAEMITIGQRPRMDEPNAPSGSPSLGAGLVWDDNGNAYAHGFSYSVQRRQSGPDVDWTLKIRGKDYETFEWNWSEASVKDEAECHHSIISTALHSQAEEVERLKAALEYWHEAGGYVSDHEQIKLLQKPLLTKAIGIEGGKV